MRSQKDQPPTKNLSDRLRDYDIKFNGPVAPKSWPDQHRPRFQVIRDISSIRYDEYKRTDISKERFRYQVDRVRRLRDTVRGLRQDFNANEMTWRLQVEQEIMSRFHERIICGRCGNERWQSDFQAQPSTREERQTVQEKRARRIDCTCSRRGRSLDSTLEGSVLDNSDEEESNMSVFQTVADVTVLHDPNDDLNRCSFRMRPDRVVGLAMTDRSRGYISSCPTNITHCPLQKTPILYPFLIVEAKREYKAPGFRAVEAQTAFPLRRFLKLQHDLGVARHVPLDPLVWFFAYQGEEWRVYAGTMDGSKVRIFDLWHGTLESQDGALQILLISDYIWSWARDIYRPQIHRCLRGGDQSLVESRPLSIGPLVRLDSARPSVQPQAPDQAGRDTRQEESAVAMEVVSQKVANVSRLNAHPFKWAAFQQKLPPWARQTTIRHSNAVAFSFHVLRIPEEAEDFRMLSFTSSRRDEDQDSILRLLAMTNQRRNSVLLTRDDIDALQLEWTNADMVMSHASGATHSTDHVRAFFFHRTSFRKEDWQIRRQLICLVWSQKATRLLKRDGETRIDIHDDFDPSQYTARSDISHLFSQIQGISGRESVTGALDDTIHILRRWDHPSGRVQLQWVKPMDHEVNDTSVSQLEVMIQATQRETSMLELYYQEGTSLLRVLRAGPSTDIPSDRPRLQDNDNETGAMLIVKPDHWPPECPRFCLFVMDLEGSHSRAHLGRLLRGALNSRDVYQMSAQAAGEPSRASKADWTILHRWIDYLLDENI